jgi:hypothetical protein
MKFLFSTVYRVTQRDFYAHPYTSMLATDLRQRIIEADGLIISHTLINRWLELEHHLDICRTTTGAHIEVFLSFSVHCWRQKFHKAIRYLNISMYLCIPLARTPCTWIVYLHLLCFVLFVLCFCIVSFVYVYSHLFCLYWCKDYCHRATTQFH